MVYSPSLTEATSAATRTVTMPGEAIPATASPGQHNPQTRRPSLPTPPSPFHTYPRWSTDAAVKTYALPSQEEYSGPCTPSYRPLRWTHPSTWSSPSAMPAMASLPTDYPMSRSMRHLSSPTPYCYPPPEGLPSITHASSKPEWTPTWTPIEQSSTSVPSPPTMPSSPLSVPVRNESCHGTSHEDFARHSRCQRASQRAVQSGIDYALQGHLSRPSTPARSSPLSNSDQRTKSSVQASSPWSQRPCQSLKRGLNNELRQQIKEPQPQQQQNKLYLQRTMLDAASASQLQPYYHPIHATVPTRAHEDLASLSQKIQRTQSDLERIKSDQDQLNSRIATETDIIALRTQLLEQIREEIREELRKSVEKESLLMRMNMKEEISLQIRQEIAKALDAETEEVHSQPTTRFDNLEQSTDASINTSVGSLEKKTDVTAEVVEESVISQRKEMQDLTHGTSISFYLLCEELRTKIAKMNEDFSQTLSRINGLENARLGAVETHIKEKFRDFEDMAWPKMTAGWESAQESEELEED